MLGSQIARRPAWPAKIKPGKAAVLIRSASSDVSGTRNRDASRCQSFLADQNLSGGRETADHVDRIPRRLNLHLDVPEHAKFLFLLLRSRAGQ
jgi:hypothetical protein